MNINDYDNQLVTINHLPSSSTGTGVILSSESNSGYYFIITARHNFGELDTLEEIRDPDKICIGSLKIQHYKDNKESEIYHEEVKAFFFTSEDGGLHDIALLILKIKENNQLQSVKKLKIYDSDQDRSYTNDQKTFWLSGYRSRSEETNYHHKFRRALPVRINTSKDDDPCEELRDAGSATTHAIPDLMYYKAVSGGGVFYQDKYGITQLRSLVLQYDDGFFTCFKLDHLAHEINEKIKMYKPSLGELEIGSFLLSDKNTIKISDITDFNVFKSDITENIPANDLINNYEIPHDFEKSTLDKLSMKKLAIQLRKKKMALKKQADDLSYIFALLALHAHENRERWLTHYYFRDAIELNEKHEQTLMLEKAQRKEQFRDIQAISSGQIKAKYGKLLDQFSEEDLLGKREIIKEAIDKASQADDRDQSTTIDHFKSMLIKNYDSDDSMRYYYKYQELGDYLHATRLIRDQPCLLAFEMHTLALQIAKLSPKTTSIHRFLGENSIAYGGRYTPEFKEEQSKLVRHCLDNAEKIISREEDPETTQMIRQIYSDMERLRNDTSGNLNQIELYRKELSQIRLNTDEQRHVLNENVAELPGIKEGIASVSSQLYRTEHHALTIAKDLAAKIPEVSQEVRTKSSRGWASVLLTLGFVVAIALLTIKALVSIGFIENGSIEQIFSQLTSRL